MIKSHTKSKIIVAHNSSKLIDREMKTSSDGEYVILQVEELHNDNFDILLEVVNKEDYMKQEDKE